MSDLIVTNSNGYIYMNRFHRVDGLVVDIEQMIAEDWSDMNFLEAKQFVSRLNRGEIPLGSAELSSWTATVPDYFSIGRVVLRRCASYRRCIVLKESEFAAKHFAKMLCGSVEAYKVWNGLIASGLDERKYVIAPVGEMLG
jgi:hypothetical protein